MCGRTLISESNELAKKAGVSLGGSVKEKDTNRPPGSDMPIIIDARPGKLHYVKWGLIPSDAKAKPTFNTTYCRIETMLQAPTYQYLVGKRHCVFVIEGFYEWYQHNNPKQPYFFERKDKGILYCAGLWDTWKDPQTEIVIPTCTMLMQPANEYMSSIHNRMPCILTQQEADIWLNRELDMVERLKVLHPVANDLLHGWPVDPKMNNARNKGDDNNRPTGGQLSTFD
jgi:putative SOS response-associated peptidase YedK